MVMGRRISLERKGQLGTPLLMAVLAASVAASPDAVRAENAGAPSASARSIVAIAAAANDVLAFMHEIDAATGAKAVRGLVRSTVGGPSSTGAPTGSSSPRSTVPDVPAAQQRQLTPADGDPNFVRWQKDADERLKAEKSLAIAKPHPLMLAHPDKSVVVCEAGCRTPKDEIVYIAAYVPAVAPARTFEPASSGAVSAPAQAPATEPASDAELPCIAGCYEKPQRNMPPPRRSAAVPDAAPPVLTAASPDVRMIAAAVIKAIRPAKTKPAAERVVTYRQIGFNGAIVQVRSTGPSKKIERAALKSKIRHAALSGWRAKVSAAKPLDWTAVVRPAVLKRVKSTERIRRVTRNGWRTKVVFSQRAAISIPH